MEKRKVCPNGFHTNEEEDWENEFDKKIRQIGLHLGYGWQTRIEDLKSFIKSLINKEREKAYGSGYKQGKVEGDYEARHDAFKECVELIKTLSELEDDKDNPTGWKETCEIIAKRITSLSQKSHE